MNDRHYDSAGEEEGTDYPDNVDEEDGVPYEVRSVLPEDPFDQLELARQIAALAFSRRIGNLRDVLGDSEGTVRTLRSRVSELETALKESTDRLAKAHDEQARLTGEKNALVATVKKLNRDVAKLEAFKRTLMQQLQDDPGDEAPIPSHAHQADLDEEQPRGSEVQPERVLSIGSTFFSSPSTSETAASAYIMEDDGASAMAAASGPPPGLPRISTTPRTGSVVVGSDPPVSAALVPQAPVAGSYYNRSSLTFARENHSGEEPEAAIIPQQRMSRPVRTPLRTPLLTPQFSPHMTPSATPPVGSATGSPRHARPPRVDGKEFFRQARNRLSYEQFSSFLANIKELNAHRQTREETLLKADDIFGSENKDLYVAFDGLLSRHLPT